MDSESVARDGLHCKETELARGSGGLLSPGLFDLVRSRLSCRSACASELPEVSCSGDGESSHPGEQRMPGKWPGLGQDGLEQALWRAYHREASIQVEG
jgi:hypothetical protein